MLRTHWKLAYKYIRLALRETVITLHQQLRARIYLAKGNYKRDQIRREEYYWHKFTEGAE